MRSRVAMDVPSVAALLKNRAARRSARRQWTRSSTRPNASANGTDRWCCATDLSQRAIRRIASFVSAVAGRQLADASRSRRGYAALSARRGCRTGSTATASSAVPRPWWPPATRPARWTTIRRHRRAGRPARHRGAGAGACWPCVPKDVVHRILEFAAAQAGDGAGLARGAFDARRLQDPDLPAAAADGRSAAGARGRAFPAHRGRDALASELFRASTTNRRAARRRQQSVFADMGGEAR